MSTGQQHFRDLEEEQERGQLSKEELDAHTEPESDSTSDGSTAKYYELPEDCSELQDLISAKDMNAQMGEIFRACYRYGVVSHSSKLRDAKKIKFYIDAEIKRLEALPTNPMS
jgi:hypothetical protein